MDTKAHGGQTFAEQRPIIELADAYELHAAQAFTKSMLCSRIKMQSQEDGP
jgi:hypothetical protein